MTEKIMSEGDKDEANRSPEMGRSIVAVLAGVLAIVILSVGTDAVLHATSVLPPPGQRMFDSLFLLATAYRTAYGVAGGYITARLAPNRPMQHALVLGAVGIVLGTAGAMATWNRMPSLGPHWYPVALIVLAVPQCWLGGVLYRRTHAQP